MEIGGVDDSIYAAEGIQRLLDQPLAVARLSDIGTDGDTLTVPAADFLENVFYERFGAGAEGNLRAFGCGADGHSASHARSYPGDHDNLALQDHCSPSPACGSARPADWESNVCLITQIVNNSPRVCSNQ
jgi:hypothetical protein